MTAEQLFALPDDGNRYELLKGVLQVMSPAGSEHGQLALAIGASLYAHVKAHGLGKAYAAETGFRISRAPDTVRAPDVAFVSHESLARTSATRGYLDLAPDLVLRSYRQTTNTRMLRARLLSGSERVQKSCSWSIRQTRHFVPTATTVKPRRCEAVSRFGQAMRVRDGR